ncbi:Kiwa anti-phage protein KwaB-like domain-containing protein [Lacticaseibacillus sharpeae]|uniref:DUF4868 domain-containing protein n=1 Tax=Lacticaseibacillus sharpeae JCM 1186 = DSM 20505 TaxID=1291052 RepID=A0A0R1ZXE2_9LACO|nr:Kiwa anti-phage protein KwaB-like domain-containing protein [Lacticaseibacillus sharpeae]KRM55763.1 hypothetical protein FC18_GL001031 [Lacticaseibacillus sharpeae JCM 1186 = DSM 20505]
MFENSSIFALVDCEDSTEPYLIDVDDETRADISLIFSNEVQRMMNKQEIAFDGKYKPSSDELLSINDFVIPNTIFDAVRDPLSVPTLKRDGDDSPSIRAIFVGERDESGENESFTIALQRFRNDQYLSTKRLSLFYDNQTFKREKRWGIGVGCNVDCVFLSTKLQFESYYYARQVFDLSQYYRSATDIEVETFSQSGVLEINHPDKFVQLADTWVRRKIASINDSHVLKDYNAIDIQKQAKSIGLHIDVMKSKVVLPDDKQSLKEILGFLDEEVYKGAFSESTFITNSKRKVHEK